MCIHDVICKTLTEKRVEGLYMKSRGSSTLLYYMQHPSPTLKNVDLEQTNPEVKKFVRTL